MSDTDKLKRWVAQDGAIPGEPVKAAGFNANGTVDLTYPAFVAGEELKCGDPIRIADDGHTVFKAAFAPRWATELKSQYGNIVPRRDAPKD